MQGHKRSFRVFVIFFIFSFLLFVFSQRGMSDGLTGAMQAIIVPLQRSSFLFFHSYSIRDKNSELAKLKDENRNLRTQMAKMRALEEDNKALRDQFAVVSPAPKTLIPAFIVGMPTFLPGVSVVDEIIIDKGSRDKVKSGDSIVFGDNLIGKVVRTSPQLSVVYLLNKKGVSFTAKTVETSALGISQGVGNSLILDNVLLSDTLKKGDMVVTKGDVQADGLGFPPDLVVGKIVSVNKKASALFQSAEVERLVDAKELEMVFVLLGD